MSDGMSDVWRYLLAFNVAWASSIGVWVIQDSLFHRRWLSAVAIVIFVPWWVLAAYRGAR